MFIRCKTTHAPLYRGQITTLEEFCETFVPVNIDETGAITEQFDKRTVDTVYLEYEAGEVDFLARKLLSESDWVTTRAAERGEAVPQEWREYREALRLLVGSEGNDISWPSKPA